MRFSMSLNEILGEQFHLQEAGYELEAEDVHGLQLALAVLFQHGKQLQAVLVGQVVLRR
jgi:hypothetical protein